MAIWGLHHWLFYAYGLSTICLSSSPGKEGMGYGDFKLLAALGAWMGLAAAADCATFLFRRLPLSASFLLKVQKKNQPFAFGPYIAIAGWIAFCGVSKL